MKTYTRLFKCFGTLTLLLFTDVIFRKCTHLRESFVCRIIEIIELSKIFRIKSLTKLYTLEIFFKQKEITL